MADSMVTGFGIIGIAFILLAMPAINDRGVDDFGLAGIRGTQLDAGFPPWENRSEIYTNLQEINGSLNLEQGKTGQYLSTELTKEPDRFTLIRVDYNTTNITVDTSVNLTLKTFNDPNGQVIEQQSIVLSNGSNTYNFDSRIQGKYLKAQLDFSRVSTNDPNPTVKSLQIYTSNIDSSPLAQNYQTLIMMLIIGFTLVTIILLFG